MSKIFINFSILSKKEFNFKMSVNLLIFSNQQLENISKIHNDNIYILKYDELKPFSLSSY